MRYGVSQWEKAAPILADFSPAMARYICFHGFQAHGGAHAIDWLKPTFCQEISYTLIPEFRVSGRLSEESLW
jgi:hypothetical protein